MKPIYFPFTYISKPVGEALFACFGQTAVYQISDTTVPDEMHEMANMDILDIRIPVTDNADELAEILKEYRRWTKDHQVNEFAFLKAVTGKIPFFDETAVSQIRADIRKIAGDKLFTEKPDPLLNARLFLDIAQEFDLQKDRLSRGLMHVEAMEQNIIKNLKGENGYITEKILDSYILGKDDPGHYLPHERIEAWASIMRYDKQTSGLFITGSRSVLEYLLDRTPEAEFVISFNAVPIFDGKIEKMENWRKDLIKNLEMLAAVVWLSKTDGLIHSPEIPGCEKKVSLSLYIVPGITPHEFFGGFIEKGLLRAETQKNGVGFKNTLFGLVEKRH